MLRIYIFAKSTIYNKLYTKENPNSNISLAKITTRTMINLLYKQLQFQPRKSEMTAKDITKSAKKRSYLSKHCSVNKKRQGHLSFIKD